MYFFYKNNCFKIQPTKTTVPLWVRFPFRRTDYFPSSGNKTKTGVGIPPLNTNIQNWVENGEQNVYIKFPLPILL